MKKAYIVYQSWNISDEYRPVAVFLDEKKCNEFIAEKNKDWHEDDKREEECKKCRGCKHDWEDAEDGIYLLKETCGRADIGTDRYGMYCENDMHEYGSRSSDYFSKYEIDLME